MTVLAFAAPRFARLKEQLLLDHRETAAIAFTRINPTDHGHRVVISDIELAPNDAYADRTAASISLSPEYLMYVANRARAGGFGVLVVHSHPGDCNVPEFSSIDDAGERPVATYFDSRIPNRPHCSMVVSPGGSRARLLGSGDSVTAVEVGSVFTVLTSQEALTTEDRFDRQVRAFGRSGQTILGKMRIAVVGVGGTGSVVAQQLAHLGVGGIILVDPDSIEVTNLNRVVGSTPTDVAIPKVELAKRQILNISPHTHVETLLADVVDNSVARSLLGADLIFLCTDSHASRAVVCQLAYQYLIPCIDMGVSISIRGGKIAYITGRVQMLAPGLPCLTCTDALDAEQIRRELLTPEQRALDPYIVGIHEPQPAVISLNSTVASLATTMFLGATTGIPAESRFQVYDGINGTVRNISKVPDFDCVVCSTSGALGRADSWPLPTRAR